MFFISYINNGALEFFIAVIATVMAVFVAMPFHEFAHAFAAKHEGDYTAVAYKRYSLAPHAHLDWTGFFMLMLCGFGWAKPVPVDSRNFKHGRRSQFLVSIAGILTNLLLGTLFLFIYMLLVKVYQDVFSIKVYGQLLYFFLIISVKMNFGLAIFNLLPLYPLDGYKIIDSFSRTDNTFLSFMRRYSIIIYFVIVLTSVYSIFYNYVVGGILEFLINIFSKILGM